MISGSGFLLNGNLLVGVRRDSLLVRLGPVESARAVNDPHVSQFGFKKRGPVRGWVVVDLEGFRTDAKLKTWLARAIHYVLTLPSK